MVSHFLNRENCEFQVFKEYMYILTYEPFYMCTIIQSVRARGMKIHSYVLVRRSFMKFMFSTVYRLTQKDVVYSRKVRDLAD
jgi:hypothetical protein